MTKKNSNRTEASAASRSRREWLGAAATGMGAVALTAFNSSSAQAAPGAVIESFPTTVDAMASSLSGKEVIATAGHTFSGDGGEALWRAIPSISPTLASQMEPALLRFHDRDGRAFVYMGDRINVQAFGALYGQAADTINQVFQSGSGHFVFPAGTYVISSPLVVPSNSKVELAPDAVIQPDSHCFINGELGSGGYTGYSAHGNIVISGGTFRYEGTNHQRSRYGIGFSHGENITVSNVKFVNSRECHNIEINACRNVRIENCVFEGEGVTGGSGEMLQFDGSFEWDGGNEKGYLPFGAYDGTPCDNCLVTGCTFVGGSSGVGTHTTYLGLGESNAGPLDRHQHRGIRIIGNSFTGQVRFAIRAENWVDSIVSNNTIKSPGVHGINILASTGLIVEGNVIANSGREGVRVQRKSHDVLLAGTPLPSERVVVRNNQISSPSRAGLLLEWSTGCSVVGNHVSGSVAQGCLVVNCGDSLIDDNEIIACGAIGIELREPTQRSVIKGNSIRSSVKEAIKATSASGLTVTQNTLDKPCTNGTNSAIRLVNCSGVVVQSNLVRSSTASGPFTWALYSSGGSYPTSAYNFFMAGSSGTDNTPASQVIP